jgi:hypothetical protein
MKPAAPAAPRPIHPALDFDGGQASGGVFDAAGVLWIVDSHRRKRRADRLAEKGLLALEPLPYRPLFNRWSEADLTRFLAGDAPPSFGYLLDTITAVIERYCELSDRRDAHLIASWIVGSYVHPLFATFPRLHFRGEAASGKTKLLQVISLLSFNGLLVISPTPAILYRLIDPLRPTFALDEIEHLDTNERRDILNILNAGYKAGLHVPRSERVGDTFRVVPYNAFAPVALAGIKPLNPVTADRAIQIRTVRGRDLARLNTEIVDTPELAHLRGCCYRVALSRFTSIREINKTQVLPAWLVTRLRELYAPLLTIGVLADTHGSAGVMDNLLALAREDAAERDGVPDDTAVVLGLLRRRMNGVASIIVRPIELSEAARRDGMPLSPESAGPLLAALGFTKLRRDNLGVRYRCTAERLASALVRHTPGTTYIPTPEPSEPNSSEDLGGVGAAQQEPSTGHRTYTPSPAGNGHPTASGNHSPRMKANQLWRCAICDQHVPRRGFRAHVIGHTSEES